MLAYLENFINSKNVLDLKKKSWIQNIFIIMKTKIQKNVNLKEKWKVHDFEKKFIILLKKIMILQKFINLKNKFTNL